MDILKRIAASRCSTDKRLKETCVVYAVGAAGYTMLELIWRGTTHWTMAVTGGICFLLVYKTNTRLAKNSAFLKCLAGAIAITATELVAGIIVNIILKWNVWDYSNLPCNFLGQICILYFCLWFLLCLPLLLLCKCIKRAVNR